MDIPWERLVEDASEQLARATEDIRTAVRNSTAPRPLDMALAREALNLLTYAVFKAEKNGSLSPLR